MATKKRKGQSLQREALLYVSANTVVRGALGVGTLTDSLLRHSVPQDEIDAAFANEVHLPIGPDTWPTSEDGQHRRSNADGPEAPTFFRWNGKRYELSLQPKQWELLKFFWNKETVKTCEVATACFADRTKPYKEWKSHISRLNNELSAKGIPLAWTKSQRQDYLIRNG